LNKSGSDVGTRSHAGGPRKARQDADGPTSVRAVITSSAFLVVFAVALLVGGRAAIDPLLRAAVEAREARGVGDIVYSMPDGRFCRHMSYDNATAQMSQGEVVACPDSVTRGLFRSNRGFAWGEH
jgi:hypothetical protein